MLSSMSYSLPTSSMPSGPDPCTFILILTSFPFVDYDLRAQLSSAGDATTSSASTSPSPGGGVRKLP